MPTQIWSVTDIIFSHYRPFFALLPHYWTHKSKFSKNEIKKKKNTWRYHHFTHVYHKWHMIYGSWDIKCNFFVILGHFLPFFPPRSPKYENIKKMKKHLEIPSFYTGVPSGYTVPEIWHVTDVIIFSFWAILFPFTPSPLPPTAQKMKISKNENNIWRYQHLSQVYLESWSYALLLLRYDMWQMWLFFIMDFFCPFSPYQPEK